MNSLIVPGSTCRLSASKGATVWEIQHIDTRRYGGDKDSVYLSKLGGDGYVNKSAKIDDLLDLEAQKLEVGLYQVLALRDEIRTRTDGIKDKARFITQADKVLEMTDQLGSVAARLADANYAYWDGIQTHYPHLDTREKK